MSSAIVSQGNDKNEVMAYYWISSLTMNHVLWLRHALVITTNVCVMVDPIDIVCLRHVYKPGRSVNPTKSVFIGGCLPAEIQEVRLRIICLKRSTEEVPALTQQLSWSQFPDSKVHAAHMGPIWGRQDPGGPYVGPMNLAIWDLLILVDYSSVTSLKWHGVGLVVSSVTHPIVRNVNIINNSLYDSRSPWLGTRSNVWRIHRKW